MRLLDHLLPRGRLALRRRLHPGIKAIILEETIASRGVVISRESLEGRGSELVFRQADVDLRLTEKEKLEQVTAG